MLEILSILCCQLNPVTQEPLIEFYNSEFEWTYQCPVDQSKGKGLLLSACLMISETEKMDDGIKI